MMGLSFYRLSKMTPIASALFFLASSHLAAAQLQDVEKAVVASSAIGAASCEFGEVYSFTPAGCAIEFSNNSDKSIRVFDIAASKPEVKVERSEVVVPPHAKVQVRVNIETRTAGGRRYSLRYSTGEKNSKPQQVEVSGFILSALDEVKPTLDMGVVEVSKRPEPHMIGLSSRETPSFEILKVLSAPSWLNVEIAEDRRQIRATVKSDADWGLQADYIKLEINTPRQKEAWIEVRADIHGDVVPSANPFDLGMMHYGSAKEYMIRLNSLSGREIKIGKVSLDGVVGKTSIAQCAPKAPDCRMIRLAVSDKQAGGSIKGKVLVSLPDYGKTLPITVWGLLFPKSVKFEKLDQDESDGEKSAQSASSKIDSVTSADKVNLSNELGKAFSTRTSSVLPPAPGNGPLLKWEVSNGRSIYGFQIFRSDSESGPFVLLNPSPIKAIADDGAIAYQWRDESAKSGSTYWYYIGTMSFGSVKSKLTAPQKVIAK